MKKVSLLNLPNALTMFRLLLVPAFVVVYFSMPQTRWLALVVFICASLTDMIDGYLARKLNQITWFGKLMDPLADKTMCLSMLYCLASTNYIAWWVLGTVLVKELYMICGAAYMFSKRLVAKSDMIGKVATFLFVAAIVLVFPWHDNAAVEFVGQMMLFGAVGLSIIATIHYTLLAIRDKSHYKA